MKRIYFTLVLITFTALHLMASVNVYTPTLLEPEDGDDEMDPQIELDWEAVAGGVGLYYKVQITTDSLFEDYQEFETELSSLTVENLLFDSTYFWRVKALDNDGESDWSEAWHFMTRIGIEMRDPESGDDDLPANFEIRWRSIDGITKFDYQIDTSMSFNSPARISNSVEGDVTSVFASNLLFGTDYYVRVRARHMNDTTVWTDIIDVKTVGSFLIEDPGNGETDVMPVDELAWDDVSGINKYILRLALDEDMQVIVSSDELKEASLDADTLDFGTMYYMNVAALHAKDTMYSDTISFETINSIEPNGPANGATNIETGPSLTWNKIHGSSKYQLQFGNEEDLSEMEVIEIINTNPSGFQTYEVPKALTDSGMTYYWRVRALHTDDTTMWSDTWSFTIAATGIGENDANAFMLYPNPATEEVRLVFAEPVKDAVIRISDLTGKLVKELTIEHAINELPLTLDVNSGMYIMTVETKEGTSVRKLQVK